MSLTNGTMTPPPPPQQTAGLQQQQQQQQQQSNSSSTLQHQAQIPVGQQVLITQQQQTTPQQQQQRQGTPSPVNLAGGGGKLMAVAQKSSPGVGQTATLLMANNTAVATAPGVNNNNHLAHNATGGGLQLLSRPGIATSLHSGTTMVTTATGQQFQISTGQPGGGSITVLGPHRPSSLPPGVAGTHAGQTVQLLNMNASSRPMLATSIAGLAGQQQGAQIITSTAAARSGLTMGPGQRLVQIGNAGRMPMLRQSNAFSTAPLRNYMVAVKNENGGFSYIQGLPMASPAAGGKTMMVQSPVLTQPAPTAVAPVSVNAASASSTTTTPTAINNTPASAQQTQQQQPLTVQTSTANAQAASAAPSQMSPTTAKKKCKNFLSTLIRLASDQPENVATNVKSLIQGLIDDTIQPEDFTNQLQRELSSSPQPCLVPFLKKSLPFLRYSLMKEEMTIDGVRAPPNSVMSIPGALPPTMGTTPTGAVAGGALGGHLQQLGHTIRTPLPPHMRFMAGAHHQPLGSNIITVLQSPAGNAAMAQQQQAQQQQHAQQPLAGMATPTAMTPARIPYSHRVPPPPPPGSTPTKGSKVSAVNAAHHTQYHRPGCTAGTAAGGVALHSPTSAAKKAVSKKKTAAERKKAVLEAAAGSGVIGLEVNEVAVGGGAAGSGTKSSFRDDDDINDVAAMGGVNLQEESQRILAGNAENIGQQIRSIKDEIFLHSTPLHNKVNSIVKRQELDECSEEVISLVSHAVQERLKTLVEKLGVIAEHRQENFKNNPRYEVIQDVKSQVQFLQELDRLEKRRHEEQEREVLIKAAKSRSKVDDPDHIAIKARAKEMQRLEAEEIRQREANETALQAIGNPKKRLKTGGAGHANGAGGSNGLGSGDISTNGTARSININNSAALNAFASNSLAGSAASPIFSSFNSKPIKKIKRVTVRDVHFLMEHEKDTIRSVTLYKTYAR